MNRVSQLWDRSESQRTTIPTRFNTIGTIHVGVSGSIKRILSIQAVLSGGGKWKQILNPRPPPGASHRPYLQMHSDLGKPLTSKPCIPI
jgi:hypothetical protein